MIRDPQQRSNSPNRRHIVFTASLLSFCVIPGWASYAPGRAAIRMLADTLREECLLYDIDIHCTFPANFWSPGFQDEEKTKPTITRTLEATAGAESTEVVAQRIIDRLERGHKHITYNFTGSMVKVYLLSQNLLR
jgi:3-dehydrosphinganine reductase